MDRHPITFFEKKGLQPRDQQREVLDALSANWDKYDYFVLNLPTGVGKTYIACGVADAVGDAYLLTSTLQLQNQYETSWPTLVNLKGRGNYTCNLNPNFTVDAAPCTVQTNLVGHCIANRLCAYYNQKHRALEAPAMITNPLYFLYSTHCGFGSEAEMEENPWRKRRVLIVDEAHNLENHLIQFAESTLDPKLLHEKHGVLCQDIVWSDIFPDDYQKVQVLMDRLQARVGYLKERLEEEFGKQKALDNLFELREWAGGFSGKVAERVKRLNTQIYALDKLLQPLKIFFNTHDTADQLQRRWHFHADTVENKLTISPLYGDFLFEDYLKKMADKFIFMSATLGTKRAFCQELGLPQEKTYFHETGTPFPPEKSPIYVMPYLKMGYKDLPETVEKIGPYIDQLLARHAGERGIIHCATYKLAAEIYARVTPVTRKRLLYRDMDVYHGVNDPTFGKPRKYTNEELLALHESGKYPNSVLLSPSMMEGVDLVDDLSAFQVVLKLPWASLADARVKKKSQVDNAWYTNKTWVHVMQASGRSTRHENDSSVTYVLDASFPYFFNQWKGNLPTWFKERLVFV